MKPAIIVQALLLTFGVLLTLGFIPSGGRLIPVAGATSKDWHPDSFWYHPWGLSGVHKGIDIFAQQGTPVVSATSGLVVYTGNISMGGNVVLTLSGGWRMFYYAHLQTITAQTGQWLNTGAALGTVGSTGNAQGKPPHLHFAIHSLIPLLNQFDPRLPQPLMRMFYVDPNIFLTIDSAF